jgi:hypothetical protein
VPIDLVPKSWAPNTLLAIFTVLALGLLLNALRDWKLRGQPLLLVCLVGAVCTNPIEGIADELGYVWYADPDQATWYRSFVPMPLWMIPAYIVFFAGLTAIVLRYIEAERPRMAFVKAVLACWVVNLLIEVPILRSDVYTYYSDHQPLSIGDFPLYWLVLNSAGPMITAVVIYRFRAALTGARLLLVLPLMPMAYGAFLVAAGFPVFNLLHSNAPQWAIELGALTTIALGLSVYWAIMELTASDGRWRRYYRDAGSADPVSASAEAPRPTAAVA